MSFQFPLATAPTANFLAAGSGPTASCPGTVAAPTAAPGHLCVYERVALNQGLPALVIDPSTGAGAAATFGFAINTAASVAGPVISSGSWAVTAP